MQSVKLQRPFQWRWNLFKNTDIHVHLLQFQPSRLASKILPHPYIFGFVAISIASRLPRSLLWSLPPGSSWKIVCFAPSSHGRENRSCNRGCKCLFSVLQKARCFVLTLLSPLRVWFAWHVQYFWQSRCETDTEGERVVPPVVALHGRYLCTNLGRRSISKGNMSTYKPVDNFVRWNGATDSYQRRRCPSSCTVHAKIQAYNH